MKYILVIGDGMADNALPELSDKTPLEYAKTPTMDALASAGSLGSVLTIPEGVPAGSDTATLSIFGCDPMVYYTGRAPIEAAASGIRLEEGDIAYRCNMVAVGDAGFFESKTLISPSAGGIEGDVSDKLVRELFESPGFKEAAEAAGIEVFPGGSFRHIAIQKVSLRETHGECKVLRSKPCAFSADLSNKKIPSLTPPHDHLGETVGELLPRGCGNAQTLINLMRLAHEYLDRHPINEKRREEGKLPANGIWFWAEGGVVALPNFEEKYKKTGGVVSAVPNCHGIGMLMGLEKVTVLGATGDLDTNYEGKVDAVLEVLERHDFAAVHIEASDECTHDGDLSGKLEAIERIDSRIVAPLAGKLRESGVDYRMLVLSDHKTLMSTRGHDGSPVPFVLYDSRCDKDTGLRYCEKDAEKGEYIADGTKLMGMLFDDADR